MCDCDYHANGDRSQGTVGYLPKWLPELSKGIIEDEGFSRNQPKRLY
jgi:hypothetical protein